MRSRKRNREGLGLISREFYDAVDMTEDAGRWCRALSEARRVTASRF